MPSIEYQALVRAVTELEQELIDFPPSAVDPYPKAHLLRCQAFVVFSHAEMQVYWEAVAKRIVAEAEARWKSSTSADRVIATLVAFRRPERAIVPNDPYDPPTGGNFSSIVEEAIRAQRQVIEKNNGIKRKNLSELLIPLGVLPLDFAETLLIQLDQTGKRRGNIVHKSGNVSLKTIRDPFAEELKDIKDLISAIGEFDAKLEQLGLLTASPVPTLVVTGLPQSAEEAAIAAEGPK